MTKKRGLHSLKECKLFIENIHPSSLLRKKIICFSPSLTFLPNYSCCLLFRSPHALTTTRLYSIMATDQTRGTRGKPNTASKIIIDKIYLLLHSGTRCITYFEITRKTWVYTINCQIVYFVCFCCWFVFLIYC